MRVLLAVGILCLIVVGCAPSQFPTPEQNHAAIAAGLADKSERIAPAALAGMWIGEKGSIISFGPEYQFSYRKGIEGNSNKGTYKLENHQLFVGANSVGYVRLEKPDKLVLAVNKDRSENFRKFAD